MLQTHQSVRHVPLCLHSAIFKSMCVHKPVEFTEIYIRYIFRVK